MTLKGRVVVIGSGAAGSTAARTLVRDGWDVTVIERGKVGGTCLWWGCMPKKALYNSARAYRNTERTEMFGLTGETSFDWQSVLAWKWHAQETYAGDQEAILTERGIRLIRGEGRFVGTDEIEVSPSGERISFDHAVVAVGSSPVVPPISGIELADTSTDALSYPSLPSTLLVVGGGFIGIEMATIFASFGTKVAVVTSGPRPLGMLDEEVASVALRRLERLGVTFHTSCRLAGLTGEEGDIHATVTDQTGAELAGAWQRVLLAVGRRAALNDLDLEAAGVQTDGSGRPTLDEALCSTNPRVWFAGDAVGGIMHTPAASYHGRTIAASIDSGMSAPVDDSLIPACLFTTPQVATVGLTEVEARASGIDTEVGRAPLDYSAAAVIEDERDGLVKLVFSSVDGRLLGAQVAGPTASDLIYSMAVALRHGATRDSLRETAGIHPAYCEMFNRAAF